MANIRMMPFYNPKGFEAAYRQASLYAGEGGKVATLPDIIDARLGSDVDDVSWSRYYTTMSAEYVGLDARGRPIVVVAHGIGPMSTMAGAVKANTHKSNDGYRRGGRISQKDFLRLAAGELGEVSVVGLEDVWARREYAFSGHAITATEVENEPLWQARLGPRWREYVECHTEWARRWHMKSAGITPENKYDLPNHDEYCDRVKRMHIECAVGRKQPCILAMDGASNCPYSSEELFRIVLGKVKDTAIGHLLAVGQLGYSHHEYYTSNYNQREQRISLASDVSCHEWSDGVRLVGVRAEGAMTMSKFYVWTEEMWERKTEPEEILAEAACKAAEFVARTPGESTKVIRTLDEDGVFRCHSVFIEVRCSAGNESMNPFNEEMRKIALKESGT